MGRMAGLRGGPEARAVVSCVAGAVTHLVRVRTISHSHLLRTHTARTHQACTLFFAFLFASSHRVASLALVSTTLTLHNMTYRDYFATETEALAFADTLIFGGVIQEQNGWYHVWQIN